MSKTRVIGTSTDAIQAAEKELGRTLPKSFSDWLLANNGKSLGALTIFPVLDARDPRKTWESIVHHFKKDWQEWLENFPIPPPISRHFYRSPSLAQATITASTMR